MKYHIKTTQITTNTYTVEASDLREAFDKVKDPSMIPTRTETDDEQISEYKEEGFGWNSVFGESFYE